MKNIIKNKFKNLCCWIAQHNYIKAPGIYQPVHINRRSNHHYQSKKWADQQNIIDRRYNDYQEKRSRAEQGRY